MNVIESTKKFLEAENKRDWQAWKTFLADDCTYEVIGLPNIVGGKDSYLAKMQRTYTELPDWKFSILEISSNQDTVIVEFVGKGHFMGEYKDHQYESVPLKLQAVCVFKFADGKIQEVREYWDPKGFERQLDNH